MTAPSLLGLSHVSLSVRDRTAARDFWVEVMGFAIVADEEGYCLLLDPGTALAVILSDHEGQVTDAFDERRTGLDHLALAVVDVESLRSWEQRLDRMGVPHSEVAETDAGHHLNLRAPDDLPVELFVMKPDFAASLGIDFTSPVAAVG